MKKDIFEYRDYKRYLSDFIETQPASGHGTRSRLAKALSCHVTYVSQVLNKDAHFSLEQADALSDFLGQTRDEAQFFLLLVQLARSGTASLKAKFQEQIDNILEKRLVLRDRVDIKQTLTPLDQTRYYSSWHYAAIHILTTIQDFQSKEAMARRLGLSAEKVSSVLEFLISIGLIEQDSSGGFKNGVNRIFLGSDSLMIAKHHTNWRMKAIESLDREKKGDIHFSTVVSFAHEDAALIREYLVKAIEGARKIVRESRKEEELGCFNLDFFGL